MIHFKSQLYRLEIALWKHLTFQHAKTSAHGFANSLGALKFGISPLPFSSAPEAALKFKKKHKTNFIYLGNRLIIPRLWTWVRRKVLTSGTPCRPGRKMCVCAYARQKWVSGPFDGNPRFQKGTQAKHNKQGKLIARSKVVFIMDCICPAYRPVLINQGQAGAASWFHRGASPKQQLRPQVGVILLPQCPH